jgi:uncharacterized LabA/DUF88 family protein
LRKYAETVFPNLEIGHIRYFTAIVEPNVEDPENQIRQLTYLRALETIPQFTVHRGWFATYKKMRRLADEASRHPRPKLPIELVCVIEQEEKGSDVNLATYLLLDAFQDAYDIAIVVSNDSDLAEPIVQVRTVLGKRVALLNPRPRTAKELQNKADIHRIIRLGAIESSQFPPVLTDENGVITKPAAW